MKLQQKLLAALLAVAFTGGAHAAIDNGTTSGGGELFFSLWSDNGTAGNTADDVSYMRDLGVSVNDWANAASPFALTVAKTTASLSPINLFSANGMLTSFMAAIPVNAIVKWNVVGNDSTGAKRSFSTAAQGTVSLPTQTVTNFRNITTAVNNFLPSVNTLSNTQNGTPSSTNAVNNSNTATFADGAAYAGGVAWGTNLGNRTAFDTTGGIGAKLPFFMMYETSTLQTGNALQVQFAEAGNPTNTAYWQLDSAGNLSYNIAAIPEADTWAMFAAGLLAVGAIARRRMSV